MQFLWASLCFFFDLASCQSQIGHPQLHSCQCYIGQEQCMINAMAGHCISVNTLSPGLTFPPLSLTRRVHDTPPVSTSLSRALVCQGQGGEYSTLRSFSPQDSFKCQGSNASKVEQPAKHTCINTASILTDSKPGLKEGDHVGASWTGIQAQCSFCLLFHPSSLQVFSSSLLCTQ